MIQKPYFLEGKTKILGHAAVDRAAVEHAVDLTRTLLSGAQGLGPRAGDPSGP